MCAFGSNQKYSVNISKPFLWKSMQINKYDIISNLRARFTIAPTNYSFLPQVEQNSGGCIARRKEDADYKLVSNGY